MNTKHKKSWLRKAIPSAVLALALMGTTAKATLLNTLISGGGSITIGDKIFADFNLSGYNPNDINVEASVVGGVYYLTFGGSLINNGNNAFTDTQLFYSVATTSGQPLITAIDQSFNLTNQGNGGTIAIGETVRIGGFAGTLVAQSSIGFAFSVLDANDPPGELVQGDQLIINPAQSKVWVTKDVFLDAAEGGIVGATILTQSFHQIPVPESGSALALLGIALIGVEGLRRKLMNA